MTWADHDRYPVPPPWKRGQTEPEPPLPKPVRKRKRKYQRNSRRRLKLWRELPYCVYCLRRIRYKNATLDHVVPLDQDGGTNHENLVLACRKCNCLKSNKSLLEFLIHRYRVKLG